MKIIFLDLDGVLNSRVYDRRKNWNEQNDKFVKTNPNLGLGLEEEHVQMAIEILN